MSLHERDLTFPLLAKLFLLSPILSLCGPFPHCSASGGCNIQVVCKGSRNDSLRSTSMSSVLSISRFHLLLCFTEKTLDKYTLKFYNRELKFASLIFAIFFKARKSRKLSSAKISTNKVVSYPSWVYDKFSL